jgi:succinate dehydrogenase / fumarate reductase cytochrome b subunit
MKESQEKHPKKRPLSPHLSIYKPQISTVLSIGHRLSGTGLFFMIIVLSWWFILWVMSKFDPAYLAVFDNKIVKTLLILTSYGFFYHLCTGIRHLIWDTGRGFSIRAINYSGIVAILASIILTVIFWTYL